MTATLTRPTLAVGAKTLAGAAGWVLKHLPRNPADPVLGGILIEADTDGATLSGFDYDTATRSRVPVDCDGPMRVLVSGRLLVEITKGFPDRPATLAADDTTARLTCGTIRASLPLMTVASHPTLPVAPPAIGTVDAETFIAAVERVAVAADRDGSGGVEAFTGVHLMFEAEHIQLSATDRYQGAIATIPWTPAMPVDATREALVPVTVLAEAVRGADSTDMVTIGLDAIRMDDGGCVGVVGFDLGSRTLVTRLIAKPWEHRLPRLFPARSTTPMRVGVGDMSAAVRRALSVRAPKTPVVLAITPGLVNLSAHGVDGKGAIDEDVACDYAGPPLTIAANPDYLLNALGSVAGDVAEFSFTQPTKPILIVAPDSTDHRHLVVPVRLPAAQ